ncbi:MAG TPA: UDP-N-acetylmuramoyl-L-alanyl-D-glutamate--2,6-diaminopimelate ligase [Patescibacteria group bacterium]|nr:UDP-N-acetylmuramoyl-L-alanyl-D-glutamate--2,6-diaminopimelate ligase [Patescibacteria group bacterium]
MSFRSVVKKFIPSGLFRKIEPYGHLTEAVLLHTLNGFPAKGLKVIGVTGTNGKTSTTFLIHRMLRQAGYNVGLMTTVAYGVNDDIRPQIQHMTNVAVPEMVARLKWMKQQGMEWLVMETTSQGLAQHRVWGLPYVLAVMTNVTHEHLDYHGTFERYRDAKLELFKIVNRNKDGLKTGVINAEDPSALIFAAAVEKPILYGVGKGDLQAQNVKMTPAGSRYTAKVDDKEYRIECHLPGSFNVSNSLAAVGAGHALGLTEEQIEKGIAGLTRVEGRMDPINEGQDFDVIVDFAHTPDSFEKLFKDMRGIIGWSRAAHLDAVQGSSEERVKRTSGTESERKSVTDTAMRQEPASAASSAGRQGKAVRGSGKLICLFGSAGRRDETKRAIQGELAGKYCDEAVITEEDDRDVDGLAIMNQIASGAEKAGKVRDKDLFLVHDRTEAINFAVNRAKTGDTVLMLGKGHEKTIERANGEHPWDEIGTTREAVRKLAKG